MESWFLFGASQTLWHFVDFNQLLSGGKPNAMQKAKINAHSAEQLGSPPISRGHIYLEKLMGSLWCKNLSHQDVAPPTIDENPVATIETLQPWDPCSRSLPPHSWGSMLSSLTTLVCKSHPPSTIRRSIDARCWKLILMRLKKKHQILSLIIGRRGVEIVDGQWTCNIWKWCWQVYRKLV